MRLGAFSLLFTFVVGLSAKAEESVATFRNPTAVSGKCVENLEKPAQAILSSKKINVRNGTFVGSKKVSPTGGADADLSENVARIVQRIDSLTGGAGLPAVNGMVVWKVPNLDILARQTDQGLTMSSESVNNLANIAHELGHKVGNDQSPKSPYTWYGLYKKNVPGACTFTHYCRASGTNPRQEEFAEVFAAYLTHPQMLLSGGPACVQAFNFLRANMFKAKDTSCANGRPISVVRQAGAPKGPFKLSEDGEDCPPGGDPIGNKDRKNVQSLASATVAYAHVAEHDEVDAEELKKQERQAAREQQDLTRNIGTMISFVPTVSGLFMQQQLYYSNSQAPLFPGSYMTPTATQSWTPMSAVPTVPTGLIQRTGNGVETRSAEPVNPPLFKKSIEVPEGQ